MNICIINDCAGEIHARGWCNMHYLRWKAHGDPATVKPPTTRPRRKAENPAWKGDDIKYVTAHARVRRWRGLAIKHSCVHCGDAAEDWAYDHTDPSERVDPETGFPFSTDIDHYIALCKPCHWSFDRIVPKER